jgi:tetratricopeptide (TPR) repeat protein
MGMNSTIAGLTLIRIVACVWVAGAVAAWSQEPAESGPAGRAPTAVVAAIGRYTAPQLFRSSSFAGSDARRLAAALERDGFRVTLLVDEAATSAAILDAVSRAARDGSSAVFFFSGCGFDSGGIRYLAAFDLRAADPVASALPLDRLLDSLRTAAAGMAWIDAARPLLTPAHSITPLSPAPDSNLRLLWSAGAGSSSHDSPELGSSVFVHFLVEGLNGEARVANRALTFRDLAEYVITATRNWARAHQFVQTPVRTTGAEDVVLDTAPASASPASADASVAAEVDFWRTARASSDPAEFQAYLSRFPQGIFAAVARYRLAAAGSAPGPAALSPLDDDSLVNRAIAYAPDLPELYVLRAQIHSRKRDFQGTIRDADRAITLDNSIADAYALRGHAEVETGKPLEAIKDFTETMRLNPNFPEIYGHRCVADVRALDFAAGVTDCTEAIRRKPGDPIDLANRGRAHLGLNRPELALPDVDASLRIDPRTASTFASRGAVHAALNQYEDAIADYDASLRLSPGNAETLLFRGIAHRRSGHCERAIPDFDQALTANGRNVTALANRAGCLAYQRQYDRALAELNAFLQTSPPDATAARSERARISAALGRYADSLRDWDELLRASNAGADDYQGRAVVRSMAGQPELALQDITEALRRQPENSSFLTTRAEIYDKLGKLDLAMKDRETAVRMSPDLASAVLAEAQMMRARKDYEQAIQAYARAAQLRPDDPQILFQRVSTYLEAGRVKDALHVLDEPRKTAAVMSLLSLRALVHSADGQEELALAEANQAVAFHAGAWEEYFAYLSRGTIYKGRKDCRSAVEDFTSAIALSMPEQTALAQRAECYATLKQYAAAAADLTDLIDKSPKAATHHLARANAYSQMDDHERAMLDYDQAISLDPQDPFARANRAMLFGKMGRFADGLPDIDSAIRMRSDSADFYRLRAKLETDLRQLDKAVADYGRAVELKPDDLENVNGSAWILNLAGQFSKAIDEYTHSIRIDPKSAWTWINRGHAYTNSGDCAHATADYTRGLELAPKDRDALYWRGRCYQSLGQQQQAIDDFSAIVAVADSDLDARVSRADSLSRIGNAPQALEELAVVLARDANNIGAYRTRAAIYDRSRNVRGAEADYRSVLQLDSNDAGTMNNLGYLLAEANRNLEEAFGLLTRSLQLSPQDPDSLDSMGWICYKLDKLDQAEKYLREAIALRPAVVIWDHLGRVLLAQNRGNEAVDAWTSAVRMLQSVPPADRDSGEITRIRGEIGAAKNWRPGGKQ